MLTVTGHGFVDDNVRRVTDCRILSPCLCTNEEGKACKRQPSMSRKPKMKLNPILLSYRDLYALEQRFTDSASISTFTSRSWRGHPHSGVLMVQSKAGLMDMLFYITSHLKGNDILVST
jgi:hypothetical protein